MPLDAHDVDGDNVAFSARIEGDQLAASVGIDEESAQLTVQLSVNFAGSFDVIVTATDGQAISEQMFAVTVANSAPLLSPIHD